MNHRLTALAATAVVLLATWTGAAAQAAPPAATTFQIAIVVGEGPDWPSGHRFDFDAALVSGSDPVAGAPVTLLGRSYGASTFTTLAQATTASDGSVHASAVLQRTTETKWVYAGDASHAATTSHTYTQSVGTKVLAHAKDRTLAGRQRVVVVGRTSRDKAGQRVSLWNGNIPCFCPPSEQPTRRIATAKVRADGTFRLVARFAHPGAKQLFVKVLRGHGTTNGYSHYLHIRVR